jgi:hypothetical protein
MEGEGDQTSDERENQREKKMKKTGIYSEQE